MNDEQLTFKNFPLADIKGEYEIKLYDENKHCIKNLKSHNAISDEFYRLMKRNIYDAFVVNNPYTRNLYLTDADDTIATGSAGIFVEGKLVGTADTYNTTVSTDTFKGVLNTNNSGIEYIHKDNDANNKKIIGKKLHLSFDFATSKANGTFNNLYLSYCDSTTQNAYYVYNHAIINDQTFIINYLMGDDGKQTDSGNISQDDNYIYMQNRKCYNNSSYSIKSNIITKISKDTFAIEFIELDVPSDVSNIKSNIVCCGGYFWRIGTDWSVTRYNLDGSYFDTFDLKSNFATAPANLSDVSNVTVTANLNYMILSDTVNMYSISKDGTIISTVDLDNPSKYTIYLNMITHNNKDYVCFIKNSPSNGITYYLIDETGNLIRKYLRIGTDSFSYVYQGFIVLNDNTICYYNANNGYMKLGHFIGWTSHLKLDEPITKTASNSMTVDYYITLMADF